MRECVIEERSAKETLYNVPNTSVFLCRRRTLQFSPTPTPGVFNPARTISFPSIKINSKELTCLTALTTIMQIILK